MFGRKIPPLFAGKRAPNLPARSRGNEPQRLHHRFSVFLASLLSGEIQNSVGAGGLEPPAPASQTRCATELRYAPSVVSIIGYVDKRQGIPALYEAHHASYKLDIVYWKEIITHYPGPALELGCGTGRVSLELADGVQQYTGIDIDPGMLLYLKSKIEKSSRIPINLVQADMAAFNFDIQFGKIIVPCNTFSTLSPEQREGTMSCSQTCLKKGGVFSASMPNPHLLKSLPRRSPVQYEDTFKHPIDQEPVEVSSGWSRSSSTLSITWYYDHLMPDGHIHRHTILNCHSLDNFEIYKRGFLSAGFKSVECFGDFDFSPYQENSEFLILLAHK